MTDEEKPAPLEDSDEPEEWTEVTDRIDELMRMMRRVEERVAELEQQSAKILGALQALSVRERNMYIRQRTPIPFQPEPPPPSKSSFVNSLFSPLIGGAGTHFL